MHFEAVVLSEMARSFKKHHENADSTLKKSDTRRQIQKYSSFIEFFLQADVYFHVTTCSLHHKNGNN